MTDEPVGESERLIRAIDLKMAELEAKAEALLAVIRAARKESRDRRLASGRRKVIERLVKDRVPRPYH